jgi:hypothetical protein
MIVKIFYTFLENFIKKYEVYTWVDLKVWTKNKTLNIYKDQKHIYLMYLIYIIDYIHYFFNATDKNSMQHMSGRKNLKCLNFWKECTLNFILSSNEIYYSIKLLHYYNYIFEIIIWTEKIDDFHLIYWNKTNWNWEFVSIKLKRNKIIYV